MGGAQEKALQRKATDNWVELMPDVVKYTLKDPPTGWKDTFVPVMEGWSRITGNIGHPRPASPSTSGTFAAKRWFQDYTSNLPNQSAKTPPDTLHSILAQAQKKAGASTPMEDNIQSLFGQWMDGDLGSEDFEWLADAHACLSRRTDRPHRNHLPRTKGHRRWGGVGCKKKGMASGRDGRTRDSHLDADGQEVDLDQPFEIGGYKMIQPGDMSLGAPISEVANCRCAGAARQRITLYPIDPQSNPYSEAEPGSFPIYLLSLLDGRGGDDLPPAFSRCIR